MINRFTRVAHGPAHSCAHPADALSLVVRDVAASLRTTMRYTMTLVGLTAILALAMMFVKPDLADHMKALSPFSQDSVESTAAAQELIALVELPAQQSLPSSHAPAISAPKMFHAMDKAEDSTAAALRHQQARVTNWIAKRYRVAEDATKMLVTETYTNAREIKIDPLLVLAVIAIESRFNPFAESPVGAQGLMQVMSKIHRDKFVHHGGLKAALNPVANMKVGSQILKEYVKRGGSLEAGLKMYVGAANLETDSGYGAKVLAEYQRLKEVANGKKVPVYASTVPQVTKKLEKNETQKPELLLEAEAESGFEGKPA